MQETLEKIVNMYKSNSCTIAIVLVGSYNQASETSREIHKSSDIDIEIILEECSQPIHGITYIDGILVDYHISTIEQIENFFANQVGEFPPFKVKKFSDAKILFAKEPEKIERLIQISQKINREGPKELTKNEKIGYFMEISKLIDDYTDLHCEQAHLTRGMVKAAILSRLPMIICRYYKQHITHPKLMPELLKSIDKTFISLYEVCLLIDKDELLVALCKHVNNLLLPNLEMPLERTVNIQ